MSIDPPIPPHSDEQLAGQLDAVLPSHEVTEEPSRPDITKAQIVGMIPLIAEFAHSFGIFTLSQPQQDSLTKLVTGGIALFGADAIIRFGRNLAKR
jgi:hypothetical protein